MNLLVPRRFLRQSYLVSILVFLMEESFIIEGQVVMFIENTKTHRVRIIWDVDELEMSKAKAQSVYDFLEKFKPSTQPAV